MNADTIRGAMTTRVEDPDFFEFFGLVQKAASELGKVFFLWSPECNDGQVGNLQCEDLSGWLVPMTEADAFERLWRVRDPRIWEENLDALWSFARWSESTDSKVVISFESMSR